jgi:competence protein ComEC
MWFTLGFGGACAWGAYFSDRHTAVILIAALLIAVLAAWLGYDRKNFRPIAVLFVGLAVGVGWFWIFDTYRLGPVRSMDGETVSVSIRATDFSRETDYGYAVDGEILLNEKNYAVCVYLNAQDEPLIIEPGDHITGDFRFKVTTNGDLGDSTYYQGSGTFLIAYQRGEMSLVPGEETAFRDMPAILRAKILSLLETAFPEDTAPFAKALLLGDSSDLSYELDSAFKVSGIRHVIAVSGLHVSILYTVICLLSGKRRVLTALLGLPVLLVFAAVAGFTPSITRACVMQGLMLLALLFDREYDPPTALSFSAIVMLACNPLAITSVSLQLSVGCMAGIFLFSGRIRDWMLSDKCLGEAKGKGIGAKLKRSFASGVSVTLSAMTVTTPLCAGYFSTVSLVSVLTNLLTLWIVTYIFCGIMLSCVLGSFWTAAAGAVAWVVSWGIRYVILIAEFLAQFSISAVYTKSIYVVLWLVFCYILLTAFLCMKKSILRCLPAAR